jgi:lipopolysaccharide export system protein LptC
VISAQTHVTINRADFELTGEAIEFNTQTKQGKLAGGVRMLIYDLEEMSASEAKSGS